MLEPSQKEIYAYIWGIVKNNNCHLYRIGGIEDHIHIAMSLHPQTALADLVKDIKLGSTHHIKEHKLLPSFSGWQEGYGAFTYEYSAKDKLIEYIKNQKEHHRKVTFKQEYRALLQEHGVVFDEKYLL